MGVLPTGTVTLLFSDIEGSTLLLRRLGASYSAALGLQRLILRSAWAAHHGTELGTEGDSFFVVFHTAADAVAAAVEAQRELASQSWPDNEQVRVRMGIHSGAPTVYDGGYVGMDVHRCARVAGAAHGGQIIITDATAHLLTNPVRGGLELLDLGAHHLKDLEAAEHLYQVKGEGLSSRFPPVRSLGAVSRLPVPATPLVGRLAELAALSALLEHGTNRLVTLTGPGGSGKTRLALELAREHVAKSSDAVHFVPLAEAHDAVDMWRAISSATGFAPIPHQLVADLRDRADLLVLDNLEQLTGAAEVLGSILGGTEHLIVVATSRRPIHLREECEYPVWPLALPDGEGADAAYSSPAVRLFLQQARRVRPSFELTAMNAEDIAEVCRALDGLPLAIEIAAARMNVLSARGLLARLGSGLDLAATVHNGLSRQRTLRATITWSHELLPSEMQIALRRLGVFAGGADFEALAAVLKDTAEAVTPDSLDVATCLVDASLASVTDDPDGEPRLSLLQTVRSFALDQLDGSGERDTVCARHARHYLGIVQTLGPRLHGAHFWDARSRLDAEQDNIRAALRWAASTTANTNDPVQPASLGLQFCAELGYYWDTGAHFMEGREWLEGSIARAGSTSSPELGRCLAHLAIIFERLGEAERARETAESAVAVMRHVDDRGPGLALALRACAVAAMACRDMTAVPTILEEAVAAAHQAEDTALHANILAYYASYEMRVHNYDRFSHFNDEAISLARASGDFTAARRYQHNAACVLRLTGKALQAKEELSQLFPAVLRDRDRRAIIDVTEDYGAVLADLGRHREAIQLLGAVETLRERTGYPRDRFQEDEISGAFAQSRAALSETEWELSYQTGQDADVELLLKTQGIDPLT